MLEYRNQLEESDYKMGSQNTNAYALSRIGSVST
jgi:hypothetical protein